MKKLNFYLNWLLILKRLIFELCDDNFKNNFLQVIKISTKWNDWILI